jgi:hypothetical protein
MSRDGFGYAASVIGAALVVAGLYSYAPAWVPLAGGLAAAVCGLLTLAGWGPALLIVAGAWMAVSSGIDWARQPWNLLVFGVAILALGFMAGALRTPDVSFLEPEDTDV